MKYLALDVGNIILHCDLEKHAKDIAEYHFGTDRDNIKESYEFLKDIQVTKDLGIMTYEQCLDYKSMRNSSILLESWRNSIRLDKDIMDVLCSLKDTKIAFLSNMGFDHKHELIKMMLENKRYKKLYENSFFHFSCDINVRKPSPLFYQSFLYTNSEFIGCLYLDDIQANLDMASRHKFNAKYFNLQDNGTKKQFKELIGIK